MPIVGNKKYPYTKVGIKKAKKHAETTGQKMVKKYKSGGSAKNLTVPQMKANAAGMRPLIATKPKGDPTGQGLRGQALTGATIKRASGGRVVPSSAETSVIKGATVRGSREGSTLRGPKATGSREGSVIKAKDGKWIQKAIKKPGALRSSLGIKKGKTIPAKTLSSAAKKKGKLGQRARLAETLKGFS